MEKCEKVPKHRYRVTDYGDRIRVHFRNTFHDFGYADARALANVLNRAIDSHNEKAKEQQKTINEEL